MGADSFADALRAAEHVGLDLTEIQQEQLCRFHAWLGSESLKAGGLGPSEASRLWDRHIADSLVFSTALGTAGDCVDLGSGTGLPGLPLAIAHPDVEFTLVDRSGRRCDLMRRAIAILQLTNCLVRQQDISDTTGRFDAVVSRAAIPPALMMIHVKRLLRPGGTALLGLSRVGTDKIPATTPQSLAISLVSIPSDILDSGASLLRIETT